MQDALTIGIEVLSIIALLLNLIALYMLSRTCRRRIGSKSLYVIVALMNILQLTLFGLSSPRVVTHGHCIVYIATGIVSTNAAGLTLLLCNYTAMLLYLLTILNSFLHKYIVFCSYICSLIYPVLAMLSPWLFEQLSSNSKSFLNCFYPDAFKEHRPKYRFVYHSVWIIAPVIANFVIIMNWNGGVVLQLFRQIHENIKGDDMHKLSAAASLAEASISEHSYLGFCSKDEKNWIQYLFFLETSVTTVILFAIAIHLAYQVKKKLKEPSLSKRTEQLQRRSSNMLLAQAINLSVLLPAPLLLQPLFLVCGFTSPTALVFSMPVSDFLLFHCTNLYLIVMLIYINNLIFLLINKKKMKAQSSKEVALQKLRLMQKPLTKSPAVKPKTPHTALKGGSTSASKAKTTHSVSVAHSGSKESPRPLSKARSTSRESPRPLLKARSTSMESPRTKAFSTSKGKSVVIPLAYGTSKKSAESLNTLKKQRRQELTMEKLQSIMDRTQDVPEAELKEATKKLEGRLDDLVFFSKAANSVDISDITQKTRETRDEEDLSSRLASSMTKSQGSKESAEAVIVPKTKETKSPGSRAPLPKKSPPKKLPRAPKGHHEEELREMEEFMEKELPTTYLPPQ